MQGQITGRGLAPDAGMGDYSEMKSVNYLYAAFSVVSVVLTSLAGNAFTMPKINGWYATLVKPSFNPPNWLFGPAWTLLFALMAFAVYRIWRLEPDTPGRTAALVVFHLQLIVNISWSAAFFGMQNPLLGLFVIAVFLALILVTIALFYPLDQTAGLLLLPYPAWVSFATVLNIAIWWLNR
jgi:translocator protein